MTDLTYLVFIWIGVYLSSFAAERTSLTPVLYFLFFGFVTSNLGLLPHEGTEFLDVFSEIGIILIMFALGFEENTKAFMTSVKRSWGIAFYGALAPFLVVFSITWIWWHDLNMSLMCGLAMTATAVSLTMVSLKSEGLSNSPPATGIMTSAVLDDIASLALVAILVPVATGGVDVSVLGISVVVAKALLFFVVITFLEVWLFPHESDRFPLVHLFGITHFLRIDKGRKTTLAVLITVLLISLLAHFFGFHPAIGAYMAGLILKEEYFHFHDHPNTNYFDATKKVIDDVAFSWIGPVFFVMLGAKLVFDLDMVVSVIPETVTLLVAIFIAQVSSAALAARYTGNFDWSESLMIGVGMLGRAELAFVVLDIAFNQHQIISTEAFYILMFTTFCLNVSVPVTIKLVKPLYLRQHPESASTTQ